ncbi:hypothetical protein, partial [Streptococcus sobrinus]|uniref:hypothetical protein n=1 Tax=Streptococcus sobrinus TaxID=1310 RepID=UPI001C3FF5D7
VLGPTVWETVGENQSPVQGCDNGNFKNIKVPLPYSSISERTSLIFYIFFSFKCKSGIIDWN